MGGEDSPFVIPSSNTAPSFVHVVDDASSVKSSVHQSPPVYRQSTIKKNSIDLDLSSDHSSIIKTGNQDFHAFMVDMVLRQQRFSG
jgi:hypothetical protein